MSSFQSCLIRWFRRNHRDLPWRRGYAPYHVWISEIMLQQTQMDRGVAYFRRWIERFPDVASIALATEEEILKYWEGLGYYARAKNIRKTAEILVKEHGGRLPDNHAILLQLPGIGRYTAGAIMSLAFNREFPVVDANVTRVLSRIYDIGTPVERRETKDFIWATAAELLPTGQARDFNQAMMELGALVCLPATPRCDSCPVRDYCEACRQQTVAVRPVTKPGRGSIPVVMATGILLIDNRILIQKRPPTGVWPNLWEFPGGRLEPGESPEDALIREYYEETELRVGNLRKITVTRHSYTVYRVTLHGYFCNLVDEAERPVLHEAQEYRLVTASELENYAFPAGHRNLLEYLNKTGTAPFG